MRAVKDRYEQEHTCIIVPGIASKWQSVASWQVAFHARKMCSVEVSLLATYSTTVCALGYVHMALPYVDIPAATHVPTYKD